MKVLHVESGRHLYGGALQVLFLLRGLPAHGVQSVLACPPGSAIAAAAREEGFEVREVPMGGDLDLAMVGRLTRLIRAEKPDLVHLHSRRGADVLGGLAARRAGVPALLSRRVDNPEPRPWAALKYRLYDHVITISEAIRQVLLAEGVPADKVSCVPSAVDTERYRPGGDQEAFRREFGLQADELTVGMAAQFIPRKGHRVLVDAAPAVLQAHPRTRFLLFGRGPEQEAIRRRIEQVGLAERFVFAGFRDDLEQWLPCLDVLAHPASMEGLGVILLQAAACGVPVVASRAGGIPEAVAVGETGLLVPPGDARALAGAVIDLLADGPRRRRLGEAARSRALQRFSPAAMAAGNATVYARLA